MELPEFKPWLRPVEGKLFKGKCIACDAVFVSELSTIKKHQNSTKHKNIVAVKGKSSSNVLMKFMQSASTSSPHKIDVKTAEIKLCGFLAEYNIIGFGSDGCNVMMGEYNSVSSRFKELCPGIFILKCICHSLHLCSSQACKSLPRATEDLARNIYTFFKSSSKRQHDFRKFQMFVEVDIHKILHPSQSRWLSVAAVVKRILEQWSALQLFFTSKFLDERLLAVEQIHQALHDPFTKLYFMFLNHVLVKITTLNPYFQSEK
ncbi:hypothetical protein NQ314_016491, partial [Rhamnusium bicolor]